MPTLYHRDQLRTHEYKRLRREQSGGHSLIDVLLHGPIGSPLLTYVSGHREIAALDNRSSDQLRINIELLKSGIFIWVAERLRSYFLPLPYGSFFIESINSNTGDIHALIHLADGQRLEVKTRYTHKKAWKKFIKRVSKMSPEIN